MHKRLVVARRKAWEVGEMVEEGQRWIKNNLKEEKDIIYHDQVLKATWPPLTCHTPIKWEISGYAILRLLKGDPLLNSSPNLLGESLQGKWQSLFSIITQHP